MNYPDEATEKPATKEAFEEEETISSDCNNVSDSKDESKSSNGGSQMAEVVPQDAILCREETKICQLSSSTSAAEGQLQQFQTKIKSTLREIDEELEDLGHQLYRLRQTARFAKLRPAWSTLPQQEPPGFIEESPAHATNTSHSSIDSYSKHVEAYHEVDISRRDPTPPGWVESTRSHEPPEPLPHKVLPPAADPPHFSDTQNAKIAWKTDSGT